MHFASSLILSKLTLLLSVNKEMEGRREVGKNEGVNDRNLQIHQKFSLVNYLMIYISCDFDKRNFDCTINLCPFESKVLGIEIIFLYMYSNLNNSLYFNYILYYVFTHCIAIF